jgi:hypothetical protein
MPDDHSTPSRLAQIAANDKGDRHGRTTTSLCTAVISESTTELQAVPGFNEFVTLSERQAIPAP